MPSSFQSKEDSSSESEVIGSDASAFDQIAQENDVEKDSPLAIPTGNGKH